MVNPSEPNHPTLKAHDIVSNGYKLIESDVRDGEIIIEKLQAMEVNPELPTLVLTECLLIYMRAEDSLGILNWTMNFFGAVGEVAYVNYEMINPSD